eukprot:6565733-Karenia_brevis.AAC.1
MEYSQQRYQMQKKKQNCVEQFNKLIDQSKLKVQELEEQLKAAKEKIAELENKKQEQVDQADKAIHTLEHLADAH